MNALDVQVGGQHYKGRAIQPVEYIAANGLNFLEGCIIKRITRWADKAGVEDLQKIKHEVDLLIDMETKYGRLKQQEATAKKPEIGCNIMPLEESYIERLCIPKDSYMQLINYKWIAVTYNAVRTHLISGKDTKELAHTFSNKPLLFTLTI